MIRIRIIGACIVLQAVASGAALADETGDPPLSTVVIETAAGSGPVAAPSGANDNGATAADIASAPGGKTSPLTDVLARMPGVSIDQNQQIHIRNTEGPQFQYQVNGVLIPLDINTNPSFLQMINPMFIRRLDLLDGVLPARYSYATGGVVSIQSRDGCDAQRREVALRVGQRETIEPSFEFSACDGGFSSYVSGLYQQSNTAFSSATPGPTAIHDFTRQGQIFGFFSSALNPDTTLSLLVSGAQSSNQLPNVPGLAPQYALAGTSRQPASADIDSYLDFNDTLAVLSLSGSLSGNVTYQLAATEHAISQRFDPDREGELIYQGVASAAHHDDHDTTVQGDLGMALATHALAAGFYMGQYRVRADDSSLVFPANAAGAQTSNLPLTVGNDSHANNWVRGVYVSDLWQVAERMAASLGLRWDTLSGYSSGHQLSPTVNVIYRASAATTLHTGIARYFQVPSLLGISPTVQQAFAGTTAQGPPGIPIPVPEDDRELDSGIIHQLSSRFSLSVDGYYRWTSHYLDTGQFGVVPIFAPFNYGSGHVWGTELATRYESDTLQAYANLTIGRNWQRAVATGQFNFDPEELAYIDSHAIVLDHQPLYGAAAGASWSVRGFSLAATGTYSSGLRAGFADLEQLPEVLQLDLSVERGCRVDGLGLVTQRLAVMNVLDRINLIRPANGIGIFQAAYGPRRTLYYTLSLAF